MPSGKTDMRRELEARMTEIQEGIGTLQEERHKIDKKLQYAESALTALRQVYEIEARRFGETRVTFWGKEGAPSRFTGMKLTEALTIIRKEKPRIDKRQARRILEQEGFDFRGKRPLSAVHFAWIALDRRKK